MGEVRVQTYRMVLTLDPVKMDVVGGDGMRMFEMRMSCEIPMKGG